MKITKEQARSFLVCYHHLTGSDPLTGIDGIVKYIKKVGCIQYDPLNIIGRNTDILLHSRIIDYKPEMLEHLLYKDRLLIDGWDKMMSIYSIDDWPYFHNVRERRAAEAIETLRYRNSEEALLYTDTVLEAITKNGPMLPKQLKLGSAEKGRWGHRNLSSATLDYLFHLGKVGVFKKVNVNKVYDLIENIVPKSILKLPNPYEFEYDFAKWYVYRRLGSVGMLWNKDGGGWIATRMADRKIRQRILDEYVSEGLVQCIEIEGITEKFYIRSKDRVLLDLDKSDTNDIIRFIAPLDNIIWDRSMLSKVFDFNYTWEVYIPAAKRKYGYYVIPVLYGNRFIARFEPQKSESQVTVKNWWWEKDTSVSNDIIDLILQEMERFALCFNKKERVDKSVGKVLGSRV